jgi:group I intron endonuclease
VKIYTITNLINGKKYVGQTVQSNPKERWYRHCSPHPFRTAISAAIKKYGKISFKFEIVDNANSLEELNVKESQWIKSLNTIKTGYNRTEGGLTSSGSTRSGLKFKYKGELR